MQGKARSINHGRPVTCLRTFASWTSSPNTIVIGFPQMTGHFKRNGLCFRISESFDNQEFTTLELDISNAEALDITVPVFAS